MRGNFIGLFIITALFAGQICCGQSSILDSLLTELRKASCVESEYVGFANKKSMTYKTAQQIVDSFPIDTIIKLTSDSSSVVCCYMLSGLVKKKVDKTIVCEIIDKLKNDKRVVYATWSDRGWSGTVGQYMEFEQRFYCMDNKQNQQSDSLNVIKK